MRVINENGNILIVDDTSIYEIDGECLKRKEKEKDDMKKDDKKN